MKKYPADDRRILKEKIKQFHFCKDRITLPYGLGCAYLTRLDERGKPHKDDVLTIEKAYEKGFRYFDTSRRYGESELVLGEFVKGIDRKSIFIATKSGVNKEIPLNKCVEEFRSNMEASLERLKCDYIDLMQIHDVNELDRVFAEGGILSVLWEYKKKGFIKDFGLATRKIQLHELILESGTVASSLTYSDFCLVNRSAEAYIKKASLAGMSIINGSPLAGGMLTGVDPRTKETYNTPLHIRTKELAIRVYDLLKGEKIPLLAVALQFPTRNQYIDINLTGPANVEQLISSVNSLMLEVPMNIWSKIDKWQVENGVPM